MSDLPFTDIFVEESVLAASQRPSRVVRLHVGEKVFSTTVRTLLKESAYFRSLTPDARQKLANETFFVDADPDLFAYVLRYLRHGIYPVCFSLDGGHDYVTYSGIRLLAEKFAIESLARWLADRQYESAIECSVSVGKMRADDTFISHSSAERIDGLGLPEQGSIFVFKRRFTAREDVFLKQQTGSA